MGNRTKRTYRNDKNGKRTRTNALPLHKLYSLFRLHFTPERNVQHSRADFFDLKRESNETAADVWKRILEVEKNCEFEIITVAEHLASQFLSLIGKSTGDYELKKKIRKSEMSVEAITEAIHEYMYDMYEILNECPKTEEDKKIRYVEQRKPTERNLKVRRLDCNRCGAPNWSKQHNCPAKRKKCANSSILDTAKCCRSTRQ